MTLNPIKKHNFLAVLIVVGLACSLSIHNSELIRKIYAQDTKPARHETILIIGVEHAPGEFRGEKYSPAYIRSTLQAFHPQVVGVESNPEWFAKGLYYHATYEAQRIAVPFAKENNLPVYGIDWIGDLLSTDHSARQRVNTVRQAKAMLSKDDLAQGLFDYGLTAWNQLQPIRNTKEITFADLNGPANSEEGIQWIDKGKNQKGSPQEYMETRDNHIVANIVAAADAHRGARLAIVIGAAHKGDLERKLRALGFTVVGPEVVASKVPFNDGAKMEARLTPQDVATILEQAWDTSVNSGITQERSQRLLTQLGSTTVKDSSRDSWLAYFQGRLLMLNSDLDGARRTFERLLTANMTAVFPYHGDEWRQYLNVAQAARLELGRIADLQGDRPRAIDHYQKLLASIKLPEYSEDYHSDYLYLATATNAVRVLIKNPYSPTVEVQARIHGEGNSSDVSMASNGQSTSFDKALELSRSGRWTESVRIVEELLKANDGQVDRCQAEIMAASLYTNLKRIDPAKQHLAATDRECHDLPTESWWFKERQRVRAVLN